MIGRPSEKRRWAPVRCYLSPGEKRAASRLAAGAAVSLSDATRLLLTAATREHVLRLVEGSELRARWRLAGSGPSARAEVHCYLTPGEKEAATQLAADAGTSLSAVMRLLLKSATRDEVLRLAQGERLGPRSRPNLAPEPGGSRADTGGPPKMTASRRPVTMENRDEASLSNDRRRTMTMTPEDVSKLSPQGQLLHRIGEAMRRGDEDTVRELQKQIVIPAEALLAAKRNMGADWIRQQGFRTDTAEKKYGKDWLDRDL